MPKINIYAGKLQIPLKSDDAVPKKPKGFQLRDKEELMKIMEGCLLLYDGMPRWEVEKLIGPYISISSNIVQRLKNETNS